MMETKTLIDFIEANRSEYIALEKLLTSKKALAPENGGEGELEKCLALEGFLKAHGITKLQRFDAPDGRAKGGIRPNLIATIDGESDDYSVWVIAHLDVVPAGDLSAWDTNPWEAVEKDGRLYGRGVEDNQQGLCSAFAAAWSFVANGIRPAHTVKLYFAADEEVGSRYGMIWLLENHRELFRKEDLFLIPDGGDKDGVTIEIAEKNILWLKVLVHGKQVHGSRPDSGKNACLAAATMTVEMRRALMNRFNAKDDLFSPNYSTFEPTMRKANVEGVNIIPGLDEFYFDCRILPQYSCDEVLEEVQKTAAKIEKEFGVTIEIESPQKAQSLPTSKDALVVKKLKSAIKKAHGLEARTIGIGGGTVGAELRNLGFECVVWSTLDDMAHLPNEYCVIDNLIKDAKTLAVLFAE